MVLVQAENISFQYYNQIVLSNINLAINRGEYVGILGPNGGGKTTLIKLLIGLLKPTSGTITWNQSIPKSIGYVPQKIATSSLDFPSTVFEVVASGLPKAGIWLKKEHITSIESIMKTTEVWDLRGKLISEVSGGQRQRVLIARSLVAKPTLLVLDEPTTGVDEQSQGKFYHLLQKLNSEGLTIVFISHDTSTIAKEAQKIVCINKSVVVHSSSEEFLKKQSELESTGQFTKTIHHHHH